MTPRPPILMLLAVLPTLTDDHALTDRLLAGDEQAFRELIRRWQGPMLRLARVHVHSQAAAEEVVQDTWLGVLNGLANFERRSSLKAWVMRARTRGVRDRRNIRRARAKGARMQRNAFAGRCNLRRRLPGMNLWRTLGNEVSAERKR